MGTELQELNYTKTNKLPQKNFKIDNSLGVMRISHNEVMSRGEWKYVGWIYGNSLPIVKRFDMIPGDVMIGIFFEKENGETTWCHWCAAPEELP